MFDCIIMGSFGLPKEVTLVSSIGTVWHSTILEEVEFLNYRVVVEPLVERWCCGIWQRILVERTIISIVVVSLYSLMLLRILWMICGCKRLILLYGRFFVLCWHQCNPQCFPFILCPTLPLLSILLPCWFNIDLVQKNSFVSVA